MLGLKNDEILTCLLLIVVGYIIAKMFSKRYEGLSNGDETTIPMCPSTKVDACWYHTDKCNSRYTDDITSTGFHTCKKGGLFSAYCISSGNECRLGANKPCTRGSDCYGECKNGKCTDDKPPPCEPGYSYCNNGHNTFCTAICDEDYERDTNCKCWPKCCKTNTCDPNWPTSACPR